MTDITPIADPGAWPGWPETDARSAQAVAVSLLSARLAVSGAKSRWPSRNQHAARLVAQRSGRRHAVLTSNGSSAIVVALHALGLGTGDTVAMPATTWVSCATAVLRVGARPVYFDATRESPCGTVERLHEPPSAILGIHLYAQRFDFERARATFPSVPIIEDASHAQFGRTADGRRIGTLGDLAIMSLQASKIITCGEGGAVLTDDPGIAERLESLVMDSRRRARQVAATAANELEPAHLLHGANHALPEISAALLVDQLGRFEAQASRRALAVTTFIRELEGTGWRPSADQAALACGAFYGLTVEIPESAGKPDEVVAAVHTRTGAVFDRVYPPVPEGPLYLPETIKQFNAIVTRPAAAPESQQWHRRHVVIPHHVFLASLHQLRDLAAAMREIASPVAPTDVGGDKPRTPRRHGHVRRFPVIDVIIITTGRRPTLEAALASIVKQDVKAEIRTTIWVDGPTAELPPVPTGLLAQVIRIMDEGREVVGPFERIAMLRDLAVRRCSGDYVAFLDDDNVWEQDHLSSLLEAARDGYPAVHSWRLLVDAEGRPTPVRRFPWMPDNDKAVARLVELQSAGVMDDGPIVRDCADLQLPHAASGMVDMGEWLIERRLLELLSFRRPRTPEEIEERLGEDDILLEQLAMLNVPVRCTRKATLRYRLGGISTTEPGIGP